MSHLTKLKFALTSALMVAVASCQQHTANPPPGPEAKGATNQQIFQVKGTIKEVMPGRKKVKIEHEEIPDYMAAMTMTFDVKDAKELAGLQPGDSVSFRMIVTENDGWIDQIKKSSGARTIVSAAPDNFRRVREVEPLKVGDLMPDYRFTNELGQTISLSELRGKAVALTFIFTRCPFPTFCPRMSSNLAEAHQKLKAMANSPTNWHLLSITIDPQFDTPAILKSYAQRYKYDPKHWSYVTGELIDITAIGEQFGLAFYRPDPSQPAGLSHNLRTVVIDAQGRVQKVFTENEWKPDDLVTEMVKAATQ